jgi:uncharacterized protein YjiS (DUF1127 family)
MTTQSFFSPQLSASQGIHAKSEHGRRPLRRMFDTLIEWRRRMNWRRELAALSALDLKDMGHPPHAEAEKAKPFWQA